MSEVSVIIPVYNVENYLERCLESVINQTFYDIEIIIVNDGSTDKSYEIMNKYKEIDKRIKIINQDNKGVCNARNKALKHVESNYVIFLDADDSIEKEMIEKLYSKIVSENSDMVFCNYYKKSKYKEENNLTLKVNSNEELIDIYRKDLIRTQCNGYIWNKIYRVELLTQNCILFDENMKYCEDLEFNIRFIKYAKKIGQIEEYLYTYHYRNGSAITKFGEERYKDMKKVFYILLNESKKNKKLSKIIKSKYSVYPYIYAKSIVDRSNISNKDKIEELKKLSKDQFLNNFNIKNRSLKIGIFYLLKNNTKLMFMYLLLIKKGHKILEVKNAVKCNCSSV